MSSKGKNLRKRKQQQIKLKTAPIFYEKTLPKVEKDIDMLLNKLDEELAENKRIIEERDRVMLSTMSHEEIIKLANSVRLSFGFDSL
ncbi:MAG: hypothetical protein AAF934_10110 [Bacteroidota bacterium]